MSKFSDTLRTGAPYHLLSYGTLLGSTLFQSFVGGVIAFRTLPRPQFAQLQSRIFPVYFAIQTALPVVMALTLPERAPSGTNGGLFANASRGTLVSIFIMFGCGLVNLVGVGPATTACMRERKHQETRDGKKSYDAGPHSSEMQRLNKRFAVLHGLSSMTNLGAFLAQLYHGIALAERLSTEPR